MLGWVCCCVQVYCSVSLFSHDRYHFLCGCRVKIMQTNCRLAKHVSSVRSNADERRRGKTKPKQNHTYYGGQLKMRLLCRLYRLCHAGLPNAGKHVCTQSVLIEKLGWSWKYTLENGMDVIMKGF